MAFSGFFLSFAAVLLSAFPLHAEERAAQRQEKYKVCTATINSSQEKDAFQKKLNPKDFEFIELTSLGGTENLYGADAPEDWFDEACKKQVQCDILIISGHFAGQFFGDHSDLELPLDTLEEHSCHQDCSGILNHPREVFLFGCNTLADKEKDRRSPEEYLEVLLHDNIPRDQAERIVQARYGAFSDSYRDSMRRIFSGVPHLYGFSSVGPAGSSVKEFLQKYLSEVGDYRNHLEADALAALGKSLSALNRQGKVPENELLKKYLQTTNFVQCPGISPDDPEAQEKENLCVLSSHQVPLQQKLRMVGQLLGRDDFLRFISPIRRFFQLRGNKPWSENEKALLHEASNHPQAKKVFLDILDKMPFSTTRADLLDLAESITWMQPQEVTEASRKMLVDVIQRKSQDADLDILVSVASLGHLNLKFADLPPDWTSNKKWVTVVGRSQTQDPAIFDAIEKLALLPPRMPSPALITERTVALDSTVKQEMLRASAQTSLRILARQSQDRVRRIIQDFSQAKDLNQKRVLGRVLRYCKPKHFKLISESPEVLNGLLNDLNPSRPREAIELAIKTATKLGINSPVVATRIEEFEDSNDDSLSNAAEEYGMTLIAPKAAGWDVGTPFIGR